MDLFDRNDPPPQKVPHDHNSRKKFDKATTTTIRPGKFHMLRYQLFLSRLVAGLAVWYATLRSRVFVAHNSGNEDNKNDNNTSPPIAMFLVTYAPIWTILCLGIYAVTSIGLGVRSVRDVPEAAVELEQQISEARKEMKKRGIIMAASDRYKPHSEATGQPISAYMKKST